MPGSVIIAAISSDIGVQLAKLYRAQGLEVIGTYRSAGNLDELKADAGIHLVPCDLSDAGSVRRAGAEIAALNKPWERFISAAGQLSPIGDFFGRDFDDWEASLSLNAVAQMRLLHALYPLRRTGAVAKVAFLVGGGINGPFRNYSAYCLGKMMLVKLCELLDDEYPDVHAIAVGTGWVNTKIHRQTVEAGDDAGVNLRRTLAFLDSGEQGTSIEDIFGCIEWAFGAGRAATGGRNVSVVHDGWRDGGAALVARLEADTNIYKLRRHGN
ncbi:SDR family NAD(P)-dependent oxidoreductase [Rhodopseudomonas palustris]|uniref:SDR family NAD(P)-dependent oxidoreductase n=1 Tax=Rhodopseudomonas palustris TaxID=1076 RepID=UPI002ACECFBA|nr:SDR family oxidoreductase [Rhodopseudomonas palustris]WQH01860.1 SDR family NAD(P)-dependent oxidoreductase [Rhodopseudomonas palustris]